MDYYPSYANNDAVSVLRKVLDEIIIQSKVEFNLALASEMNGDLDLAIEWGLKSFKSRYSKAIEVYLKTLDNKRIAQLKENKKRY